jgi:phosphoribosyl 1,2-cyclic phosphodiesterase
VLGYEGAVHGLRSALFEQMQSAFFPVGLNQMASHVTFEELHDMEFDIGPVKARAIFANHPGICLAYRLSTPNGDIVFMPDHEAYERQEIERQRATGQQGMTHLVEYARHQDEKTVLFLRDADLVIADSQYNAAEYRTRRGWGHSCADDTVTLAARAGVKQLMLFHHDPDHNDGTIQSMERRAQKIAAEKGSSLVVTAAREGAEIVLKAGKKAAPPPAT